MTKDENKSKGNKSEKPPNPLSILSFSQVEERVQTRKRGLFRRSVLFASGGKTEILKLVPTEEAWFSVIGTFVFIGTALAAFGAFALSGYFFEGKIVASKSTLIAAGAWGLLIFVMDRAIVRTPQNQVRFSSDTMEMLSGAEMDVVFQDIAMGSRAHAVRRTPMSFIAVLASMLPRLLIAFLASYLVAEAMLIAIYSEDIGPIVTARENSIREDILSSDASLREKKLKDLDRRIDVAIASLAPKLAASKKERKILRNQVSDYESDVGKLRQAYAAECNELKRSYTLSTGLVVKTTGEPGCGEFAPGAILALQDEFIEKAKKARKTLERINADIADWESAVSSDPEIRDLRKERAMLTKKPDGGNETDADSSDPGASPQSVVRGIGIREAALRDLEHDTQPETVSVEEAPPCETWICSLFRFFVYPSPAGRKMAAIRWILFLIEIMAVLLKISMVLRRRRPYDTLLAALEVVHEGSSVALAGNELASIGTVLEQQSAYRRQLRVAAVADVLLRRVRRSGGERGAWRKPWSGARIWRLIGGTDDISDSEAYPAPRDMGGNRT